jgi:tetraacyldisaccharide 4'-kinase
MSWRDSMQQRIERGGDPPGWITPVLALASTAQAAGMWLRHRRAKRRVGAQVVSFGNITAGGTGKTPAVIERALQEISAGRRVAVVSRGYGARKTPEPLVLEPGRALPAIAQDFGDELAVIHLRAPEAILIKSADRYTGALEAQRRGAEVILLDDGFQSVSLERDEDIVLLDARRPFSNGHLIPRGLLRERPDALRRATELWLTRCDAAEDLDDTLRLVRAIAPDTPLRLTRHAPQSLLRLHDSTELPLDFLHGKRIAAACGIANPDAFLRTLEDLGATVAEKRIAPDHQLPDLSGIPETLPVVMTEKDAVKLQTLQTNHYALRIGIEEYKRLTQSR